MVTERRAAGDTSSARRAVLTTAVWSVPALSVATAAPAIAASPCSIDLPAPSAANGWTSETSPPDGLPYAAGTNDFQNDGYNLSKDPNPASGPVTVTVTSPDAYFDVSNTYTFSFDYVLTGGNPRQLSFDLLVDGEVLPEAHLETDVPPNSGTLTIPYTPTTSGTKTVTFLFAFDPESTQRVADDIRVTSFSVSCA